MIVNSGLWPTISPSSGRTKQLSHKQGMPGIFANHANRQPVSRICPAVEILNKAIALAHVVVTLSNSASNLSGGMAWFTRPQFTLKCRDRVIHNEFVSWGFGPCERPVQAARAPFEARRPSPRSNAVSTSCRYRAGCNARYVPTDKSRNASTREKEAHGEVSLRNKLENC